MLQKTRDAEAAGKRVIPAAGSQPFEINSPTSRREFQEELERKARAQKWDERYGDYAMITCVEKLLHTFVPDRTIGEVADDLPKDKGTIYDILNHVMFTYGAFTSAIEDMLKDIKKKADVFEGEIASQACGRKASRHEQSVAQRPSSSSRAEVKLEEHDTGSKARKSQEIKKEKVEKIHPRCNTEEWLDDQKRGRSPVRRWIEFASERDREPDHRTSQQSPYDQYQKR